MVSVALSVGFCFEEPIFVLVGEYFDVVNVYGLIHATFFTVLLLGLLRLII